MIRINRTNFVLVAAAAIAGASVSTTATAQGIEEVETAGETQAELLDLVQGIVADENWYQVERRGYKAQRDRPSFEVRSQKDLTVYEQRDLDRQGRVAQRTRGARLPNRAETIGHRSADGERFMLESQSRAAKHAHGDGLPVQRFAPTFGASGQPRNLARTKTLRPETQRSGMRRLGNAVESASQLDFASEAFGGRELGFSRYASDLTIGQVSNALNGGDPVLSLARSTNRLGRNFESGLTGIGQSIIDPRRIPGNAVRAIKGTLNGTVETARWAGETAGKTIESGVRIVTQPGHAKKESKKAVTAVQNVAQSACKGLSWIIPSNTMRKKGPMRRC